MFSKTITLKADGTIDAACGVESTNLAFATTLIDPDVAVTGLQKYAQLGLVAFGTAMFMNKRHTGELFNFG